MKFKNTKTGNILETSNEKAIALLDSSDRYVTVTDTPTKQKSLDKMTTAELVALATEKGVDLSNCNTNAERIEAIKAAE
jgi:hypothetical protein